MSNTTSKNDLGPYELEVGLSGDEREVIVNHPEMTPNPGGRGGHIVFSPKQARAFAALMIEKANACVGQSAVETSCGAWQPMKTAPRNGSLFLAHFDGHPANSPFHHFEAKGRYAVVWWGGDLHGWVMPGLSGLMPDSWLEIPQQVKTGGDVP